MKLLMVHSGSDLYGASRSLLRMSTRLAADGHSVIAVLPFPGPLEGELRAGGVEVIVDRTMPLLTRSKRALAVAGAKISLSAARLAATVARNKPDVIHTNTATVLLTSGIVARALGVPHVHHIREFFAEFPRTWPTYRTLISAMADRVICVSEAVARQFPSTAPSGLVTIIHNGLPAAEFEPVDPERVVRFRREHGLEDKLLIGVTGRIKFGRKGQDTFVRAAALLRDRFPAARFVVIGSPFPGNDVHLTNLCELIRSLGLDSCVVRTGDVQDIKAAMSALDVAVLPSGQPEPFGGVVLEAMALGKPVVGTSVGGTVEQIAHGETGFLVPVADPPALAEALSVLLADRPRRQAMGAAGRMRYEQLFEFERFYARLLNVYASVLGQSRRSSTMAA